MPPSPDNEQITKHEPVEQPAGQEKRQDHRQNQDHELQRRKIPWLWLAGGMASVYFWVNRRFFTCNDVTAGESTAYPNLKPRVYPFDADQVFGLAEVTARDLPRWRVISVDRLGREIQAEAQTPVFGLVDDVTIRVNPVGPTTSGEVVVRSCSRKGVGDLGENARRIRAYYHSLDLRIRNATQRQAVNGGREPAEAHR